MKDCGCEKHGVGVVPGPCIPQKPCKEPTDLRWKTFVLPASVGTDAEGQPYAPVLGAHTNAIVKYLANGAVYIYDSRGVFTNVKNANSDDLGAIIESIQDQLDELYTPAKIAVEVPTYEDLLQVVPSTVPGGEMVYVAADEKHNGEQSLYYYDAAEKQWAYAGAASPYLRKEVIRELIEQVNNALAAETAARESDRDNLQTNINQAFNAITQSAEFLQTNINKEVNAREAADTALTAEVTAKVNAEAEARENADNNLQTQLDALVASTDVKDVVGTKAELDAYDTSTLGNNDIIKVLNDESEDGAITYYRWSTADNKFTLIGETGPYYTKAEADEEFATKSEVEAIDTTKLDGLADIKTIGENLELTEDGTLNATGGSDVALYDTFSEATDGANTAAFINEKLNGEGIVLGEGAYATTASTVSNDAVVIGQGANYHAGSSVSSSPAGVVIGKDAQLIGPNSVAIGANAGSFSTTGDVGIAIGYGARFSGSSGVALGQQSYAHSSCVAIGNQTKSTGANAYSSVIVGESAVSGANNGTAIGTSASVSGVNGLALGHSAKATQSGSVAVGYGAQSTYQNSVAMGTSAVSSHQASVALGSSSATGRTMEVSIGNPNHATASFRTRYLANVTAGELDTDAVNLKQMKDYVAENAGGGSAGLTPVVNEKLVLSDSIAGSAVGSDDPSSVTLDFTQLSNLKPNTRYQLFLTMPIRSDIGTETNENRYPSLIITDSSNVAIIKKPLPTRFTTNPVDVSTIFTTGTVDEEDPSALLNFKVSISYGSTATANFSASTPLYLVMYELPND